MLRLGGFHSMILEWKDLAKVGLERKIVGMGRRTMFWFNRLGRIGELMPLNRSLVK